jgi:tripartite-type tricarboxylate transporter receptor subunit TctC
MRNTGTCIGAAIVCISVLASAPIAAQTAPAYPNKPIRLIVGFAAGGPTDVIARVLAQHMTTSMGQTVVVENRTGANAIIATELVARAAPDGYTTLFSSLSLLVNALLSGDKIKYDPFKDFAPVSNTFMVYPIIGIADFVAAGKLKVLAVGTAKRHPDFPNVPTAAEAGFAGFEQCAPWVGLIAPAGTPQVIVNRLSDEMRKALARPETASRLSALGAEIIGDSPEAFQAFLKKDYERWAQVIKAAGVKPE